MNARPLTGGRYVAIHGHFYQPPRENPWLEAVEVQDSAAPYHDWNERVAAECYAPNTAARRVGQDNRIIDIVRTEGFPRAIRACPRGNVAAGDRRRQRAARGAR
jgi:hypothetical protein